MTIMPLMQNYYVVTWQALLGVILVTKVYVKKLPMTVSGEGDFPVFTPAEAGTRFSDLEGCKAELT